MKSLGSMLKGIGDTMGQSMPMSPFGLMDGIEGGNPFKNLFGGESVDGGGAEPANPGQAMFGMSGTPAPASQPKGFGGFLNRFGSNLQEQLFRKAMQGFMGGMQ